VHRARVRLSTADHQLNRMKRLIDDMLDVTRIQAGQLVLQRKPFELVGLVREALAVLEHTWADRTITLDAPARALALEGDADRIAQVVTNLVNNACKFSDAATPVEVGIIDRGEDVRVSITDQGPGLTEAQQDQLFRPFMQVEGVRGREGADSGLGLGLYICHSIILAHGGAIGVASTPGQGATFWFTLPLKGDGTV
jgi:signal transduction histidine kinase